MVVNNGGLLGGAGTLSSVTVSPSGAIAPGNPLGTLTMSGGLDLAPGAEMDYELDTPTTSSLISSSSLSLNGQQFTDFNFLETANFRPGAYDLIETGSPISGSLGASTSGTINGDPASLSVQGGNLVLTVVPEPGTLALLAAGAVALLACGWRQRLSTTAKQTTFDRPGDPAGLSSPSQPSSANAARWAA